MEMLSMPRPWLVGVNRRTNEDIKRRLSLEQILTLIISKSWPYRVGLDFYPIRDKALMALHAFCTFSSVKPLAKPEFEQSTNIDSA